MHADFCNARAKEARDDAEQAGLANVRDRALRSAAVWQALADRAERVGAERKQREAASSGG